MLVSLYLADDGVVSGGDRVEDPLDAFELLFIAGGDPVKGLIIVLQSTTALTGRETGNRRSSPSAFPPETSLTTDDEEQFHLHVKRVSHLHVSHLHQSGEVHLLLHLPVAPHLH